MSRAYHLRRKYGITTEQYDDLLRTQEGCCWVCERPAKAFHNKLCVDHDHKTGEIRGLLCTYCNRYVVGRYRRENGIPILSRVISYLNREYTGWFVPKKKKKRHGRRKRKN